MSEYNPEQPSENEPPEFVKAVIAAIGQRSEIGKAMQAHRDKVELKAQEIAQRLRVAVYEATDQANGPSESEAFGALKQWRKAVDKLGPIMRRTPSSHIPAVAQAIVDMVRLYEQETCPTCRAERGEEA